MKHGSLFSGIGGFDLAASWHDWQNVFQVEIDPFCNRLLERHFPATERYGNIKEFDGSKYRKSIDVLSGGFPCQPFSTAGSRKGTADQRHLWPEMLRIIREVRPSYVVGENVEGAVSLVLEQVWIDLEDEGYEVWPMLIPALSVGAAHYRKRLWIVAYSAHERCEADLPTDTVREIPSNRLAGGESMRVWDQPSPPRTSFCGVPDGIPDRVHRLKALGNAVVPQVAYYLFDAIQQHSRAANAT